MTKQRQPTGLGAAGKRLWGDITDGVTYRADELAVLESACRLADRIDQLETALKGKPLMVMGSRGQQVVHPLIPEIRATRAELIRHAAKLDVPEADGSTTSRTSHRRSAKARWNGGAR